MKIARESTKGWMSFDILDNLDLIREKIYLLGNGGVSVTLRLQMPLIVEFMEPNRP